MQKKNDVSKMAIAAYALTIDSDGEGNFSEAERLSGIDRTTIRKHWSALPATQRALLIEGSKQRIAPVVVSQEDCTKTFEATFANLAVELHRRSETPQIISNADLCTMLKLVDAILHPKDALQVKDNQIVVQNATLISLRDKVTQEILNNN